MAFLVTNIEYIYSSRFTQYFWLPTNIEVLLDSHNNFGHQLLKSSSSRDPDSVLLLSSQMRSQLICFESVPKIVTLTDH